MTAKRPSLMVVGSVAYDDIRTAELSGERLLGGSASHFSFAAALAGAHPRVVAVVGEDFDRSDIELLAAIPADLGGLAIRPGKSFRWGGAYNEDFSERVTLFTELGVFEDFQPELPESFKNEGVIFLANIHPALQGRVLDAARSPRLVALDTMNLWIDLNRAELEAVLPRVDLFFVNEEEARMLSGETNLVLAGEKILEMGPRACCLKKGEHGVLLFVDGQILPLPGFPVRELVDPTGAGDCFAGGVMGCLAASGSLDAKGLREACLAGSVLGSMAVEGLGVTGLKGRSHEEFRDRLAAFKRLLGISG